jgi:polyisoprenoid-binding protein YceI
VARALRLLWLGGILAVRPALAEPLRLELDPAASEVQFTLGATLHKVEGSLRIIEGTVRLQRETGEATGQIVVDAASAQTGNKKRDRDMHDKVLESQAYPRILLDVKRVQGEALARGSGKLTIEGAITIHGQSHPVTVPADIESNGEQVEARAVLRVPYVAWGLRDPSFLMLRVEKEVEVRVRAVGRLSRPG